MTSIQMILKMPIQKSAVSKVSMAVSVGMGDSRAPAVTAMHACRAWACGACFTNRGKRRIRPAHTTLDTSLLSLVALLVACGFAPRLNRPSKMCWVVLAALSARAFFVRGRARHAEVHGLPFC
jgi:hypothetical protein